MLDPVKTADLRDCATCGTRAAARLSPSQLAGQTESFRFEQYPYASATRNALPGRQRWSARE